MPRAIWTGSISFGLVSIPVKLVPATRDTKVRFHMLHADDGVRVRQKLVCPAEDKEISRDDLVKGYEVAPGEYVTVTGEELDSLAPDTSQTIDISDFVDISEIDPIYYDRPYYLIPEEQSAKPYNLLIEAMKKSKRIGVGKFVMHNREHLAALRPMEETICLETMRFSDEVLPESEIEAPGKAEPDKRQLQMAEQLIDMLSTDFEPEKYHNEYREAVKELVRKKEEGEEIVAPPAVEEKGKVVNLMDALEKSLSEAKVKKKEKAG